MCETCGHGRLSSEDVCRPLTPGHDKTISDGSSVVVTGLTVRGVGETKKNDGPPIQNFFRDLDQGCGIIKKTL